MDSRHSVKGLSPFSVLLIAIAMSILGITMLPMLNIQHQPSAKDRYISVSFGWSGASSRLMEQMVTSRIEGALMGLAGCNNVSSYSNMGYGSVTVNFNKGTDMTAARFDVATRIRNIYAKLPEGVSYPTISMTESGYRDNTVLSYTIKAGIPSEQIYDYVQNKVVTPLSRVEGVGKVSVSGATPYEWIITFDPERIESAGLSAEDLATAFNSYFSHSTIGMTTVQGDDGIPRNITLKLQNSSKLDFENIPITRRNGRILYLRDFATIKWREALPSSYFRINGLNVVTLNITVEGHTNSIRGADGVRSMMHELQKDFPEEITASLSYDASIRIKDELHKIYRRTLWCVAILLLLVFVVSRDLRYLLMIVSALTINIFIAVVFYHIFSLKIHIYTLAGITVSLGVIIDTAIIMVDHYSYYHNRKIFLSILGALLTTIGALTVIWLLPEGQRLSLIDFALVIIINLVVSLLVSVLFIPAMLDMFPLRNSMTQSSLRYRRFISKITTRYERFILWGRAHRWIFIVILIWGFGLPTFLLPDKFDDQGNDELPFYKEWYNSFMGSKFVTEHRATIDMIFGTSLNLFNREISRYDYYRDPTEKVLTVNAGMPEGCTVQQLNDIVRHMENYISRFDQVASFHTNVYSYDNAQIQIRFKREWENTSFPAQLKQEIISAATNFGGATWSVSGIDETSFNNNISNTYRSNVIRLYGYNYDQLSRYAEQLIDLLKTNRRVLEPKIMDGNSWSLPKTEFHVRYKDEQIAATGLNIYDYYGMLHTQLYKSYLTNVYTEDEIQRVVMESSGRDRFDRWHLENALVDINSQQTKLSEVGSIEKRRTGIAIRRSHQSYEISVGYDFIGSYELNYRLLNNTVNKLNKEILPLGFRADSPSRYWGGNERKIQVKLILLIVAIIYTMCSVIFESLRKPIVIIMMIPISFIGVFLTFGLSNCRFDQGGFVAFALLCGIVVNAGIYIITECKYCQSNTYQRGVKLYLKAFNHKIIPIMLTIISTILGLIPFLYDGSEEIFWFAFAIAATSGTAFSIIALLIYLPIFMPFGKMTGLAIGWVPKKFRCKKIM